MRFFYRLCFISSELKTALFARYAVSIIDSNFFRRPANSFILPTENDAGRPYRIAKNI